MNYKKRAKVLSFLWISSYIVFFAVYCTDLARNWESVRHFNALDVRFTGLLLMILLWFLPVCLLIYHDARIENMKRTMRVSKLMSVFLGLFALMGGIEIVRVLLG